ncbi:hypothetical protein LCGC14_2568840 [marine sediment metagenome]|uniref:UDP-glucose/GDP-mannose dehydrogenase dimerisation domain-containing protein n=1 Tax=marine sediment metagenome TaxID=412755 RepID=A0A0F9AI99_9ZZZZ
MKFEQKPKIGIVGAGFVGRAIARGFSLTADVKIYDKDPKRSAHSFEEICNSDFIFLCLPTPMEHAEGGKADLTIIYSVCQQVKDCGTNGIMIIKSTVPIGTTRTLREKFGLQIIHNPEFLTARNANIDFITPARTILGGTKDLTHQVAKLFADRFPGNNIFEMTSNESEAVKYIANCFFAVKVIYFNEVFLGLKQAFGLNWEKVMEGVLTDGRIGVSHYDVPGHDGKLGFGGYCFPKDICALIHQLESSGFDPKLLNAAWEQNKLIRPEMDWGRISNVVSSNT